MTHFKWMELREVCNVYQPETISKKSLPANGKYPVYGANGKIGFNDKFNHEEPQLLLGCRGSVGSIHISEAFSWINGNAMVVQPFEDIVTRDYLKYALLGGINIKDAISGTAQPQITRESLSKIKIPVPSSLKKQDEIVEKLDSAFTDIDLLEDNLTSSEGKANELLNSILNSEYAFNGVKIEPLEKLVYILDNQRIPVNATERQHRIGDVPYYGATGQVGTIDKAIFNETLILLGEDGVPFFDPTKHKAYEISGPSWVNNHAHVLRAKPEVVQRYLLHFLNIFNYTGYVNGATRLKLTQGDMKRIPVPVPDIDVQAKIVSKIDLVYEEINDLKEQIALKKEITKELRRSLLNSSFTEVSVVA